MIKFPKVHIAESVTNRILNIAEDLDASQRPPEIRTPPPLPDTISQSFALDQALATPPGEQLPPIGQVPNAGNVVQGKPALAAMLEPKP